MLQIELIAIGSELLLGDVLDSNSHWLCGQFTRRGGQVRRVVQVRDEIAAIAHELRGALARGTDLIVTGGGLGPTDDDLSLRAVAEALGRPLQEHPVALDMIRERYRRLAAQGYPIDLGLSPPQRKMAQLPRGAEPLHNPAGSAPGVLLHEGKSTIICLPGVPAELEAMFSQSLAPLLQERFAGYTYDEWSLSLHCCGESTLAALLRRIVAAHPSVYVKTRAQGFDPTAGGRPRVLLTLSLAGTERAEVEAGLERCMRDLLAALEEVGATIENV